MHLSMILSAHADAHRAVSISATSPSKNRAQPIPPTTGYGELSGVARSQFELIVAGGRGFSVDAACDVVQNEDDAGRMNSVSLDPDRVILYLLARIPPLLRSRFGGTKFAGTALLRSRFGGTLSRAKIHTGDLIVLVS